MKTNTITEPTYTRNAAIQKEQACRQEPIMYHFQSYIKVHSNLVDLPYSIFFEQM